MSHTDPIADMLTRIRNACRAHRKRVEIPSSKMKAEIAKILLEEKFISAYRVTGEGARKSLRIQLKYSKDGDPAIVGIRRISRPGLRKYVSWEEIPPIQGGLGIAILSTSHGILTDHKCKEMNVGGEVLAHVW
ncbi:MAG: 30S ribosomal protein S8 [Candidatus Glassbacteria bacterium]